MARICRTISIKHPSIVAFYHPSCDDVPFISRNVHPDISFEDRKKVFEEFPWMAGNPQVLLRETIQLIELFEIFNV